jgi:glycosyl-4,4'-diaponeurosporenoate acyltransferase
VQLLADVVAPSALWATWNIGVAVSSTRLPASWFQRDLTNGDQRPPLVPGVPRRLGVRRWKHLLPDAGSMLPGAFTKRHLGSTDPASLARFAAETRRSELVHWLSLVCVVPCVAWRPAVVGVPMVAVAVLLNGPCILALRDTRARIVAVLDRQAATVTTSDGFRARP